MDNYNNTNHSPQPDNNPAPTPQSDFNQNNGYRPNSEFNQGNGYRPNSVFNQDNGYRSNSVFNQNNGYRPNSEFNQNNGYRPNSEFNQNNGYRPNTEFNQNNNFYNPATYNKYNNSYNSDHNYNPHNEQNNATTTTKKTSDSWLFIIVGLIFMVIGTLLTLQQINDRTNYNYMVEHGQSTYAEITDIQRKTTRSSSGTGRTRTSSTKTYYYIDGIYEVDNQQYTMEFKTQTSSHYVGESIKLYYEVGNPSNYVREGDDGGSIIFGIIFASMGLLAALAGIKDYRDKKALKAMGL
ncbi:MAG: DUF3592 domain-containing protein [Acutalibacteraceae bacterium]|nr:DUF3592 domain-containing protein [Acutalibacteraceae bacterium]